MQFVAQQRQQFLPASVADDQPLLALPCHVAHGDVGQRVGVVDAGAAGQREEVGGELADGELQERDRPAAPIAEAQLHMVIRPELQICDAAGLVGQQGEELVEVLRRRVVGAGRADHKDAVKAEPLLQRAQGVDLARDADHRDAAVAGRARRLQQGEQRRVAHPHAPALCHARGLRHQHRDRTPGVVRVRRHREHGIDGTGFQQALGDAGGDAGPLRAGLRRCEGGAHHASVRAEEQLVWTGGIAGAAVHAGFEAGVVGRDELAGGAAIAGGAAAGDAAIRAQAARGWVGHGRCPNGRGGGHGRGFTPFLSACTEMAVRLSSPPWVARTVTAAPGTSRLRSPGIMPTTRTSGATSISCSPPG